MNIYSSVKIEILPQNHKFYRLLEDFSFYSEVLNRTCTIPKGFIFDLESVPLLKGTNPEAGAIHDYLCRVNSDPIVSKSTAADVYDEAQDYYDEKESGNWFNISWDWIRSNFKTTVVRVSPGYFHKFKVLSTYEEITS